MGPHIPAPRPCVQCQSAQGGMRSVVGEEGRSVLHPWGRRRRLHGSTCQQASGSRAHHLPGATPNWHHFQRPLAVPGRQGWWVLVAERSCLMQFTFMLRGVSGQGSLSSRKGPLDPPNTGNLLGCTGTLGEELWGCRCPLTAHENAWLYQGLWQS